MNTNISTGSPQNVQRWASELARETIAMQYFSRFIGKGQNNIIEEKKDLEAEAGDTLKFDLSVQLREKPVKGSDVLDGKAEALRFYQDEVKIDQARKAVSLGDKMSQKRTIHNLRVVAKERGRDFWSAYNDQECFINLSGARGINEDYIEPDEYDGHAGNPLLAPDADHIMFGGSATSKANLSATSKLTANLIEKMQVRARMMRSRNPEAANMVPINVEGGKHYVLLMSPYQQYDLRTETGERSWLEFQKEAATRGKNNGIFSGSNGMIADTVLHTHESVVRFDDYGVGGDVPAARALFMGRQAAICAYGTPQGKRFQWIEEPKDFGDKMEIANGCIYGIKKTRFRNRDFGVMAIDTYASDPTT